MPCNVRVPFAWRLGCESYRYLVERDTSCKVRFLSYQIPMAQQAPNVAAKPTHADVAAKPTHTPQVGTYTALWSSIIAPPASKALSPSARAFVPKPTVHSSHAATRLDPCAPTFVSKINKAPKAAKSRASTSQSSLAESGKGHLASVKLVRSKSNRAGLISQIIPLVSVNNDVVDIPPALPFTRSAASELALTLGLGLSF